MSETTGTNWSQLKIADRHGTATKGQASDGTGTAGNVPMFLADGSLTDSGVSVSSGLFVVVCYLIGAPADGQIICAVDIPTTLSTVSFPANFAGSVGRCDNPTATAVLTVKKNGTSIGTMTISTSGVYTFATTSGTAKPFSASDELSVVNQSPADATLGNIRFSIYGTR